MNTLVLYESQFGNTQKVAEFVGRELEAYGPVRVASITDYEESFLSGVDLLVIGAPTQAHGTPRPMKDFLARLDSKPAGIAAAAFDTRLHGAEWLTGAASHGIAAKLRSKGFKTIVEPESFIVTGKSPELVPGEEKHAKAWAGGLVVALKPAKPVLV
jgi:flavodoxin